MGAKPNPQMFKDMKLKMDALKFNGNETLNGSPVATPKIPQSGEALTRAVAPNQMSGGLLRGLMSSGVALNKKKLGA